MSFCEHVLALSISDSWDHFFNNLQQIRYKDGIIGMKSRNHYTMADWLPENNWIIEDVSKKVGGEYAQSITRTISHKTFFARKGIHNVDFVKPDRTLTIDYVVLRHTTLNLTWYLYRRNKLVENDSNEFVSRIRLNAVVNF